MNNCEPEDRHSADNGSEALGQARTEIARIDTQLHRLISERTEWSLQVERIKARYSDSFPLRPSREVELIRTRRAQHQEATGFAVVEHVFRHLIAESTRIQHQYSVIAGGDSYLVRDLARFHFGYGPSLENSADGAEACVRALSIGSAIAVVLSRDPSAWWQHVLGQDTWKVVARIPFYDHPSIDWKDHALIIAPADIPNALPLCDVICSPLQRPDPSVRSTNQAHDMNLVYRAREYGQDTPVLNAGEHWIGAFSHGLNGV